jgi:16S rRNA processing protein RimM
MIERFVVGHVGQPFGLEGFVKIHSASGEWGHLLALTQVVLSGKSGEKTFIIEESRENSGQIVMKFQGIESPEAAKALAGAALLAGRDQAVPLAENEFYIEDLKGLTVRAPCSPDRLDEARGGVPGVHETGGAVPGAEGAVTTEVLGTVLDLIEGGGGWLVELGLNSGGTRLVPFRIEFFGPIDEAGRTITLLSRWILE